MKTSSMIMVTVLLCVASVLISQVAARPYDGQISEKDRQAILQYAARIVRLVLQHSDLDSTPSEAKRNSGMLDAVMNMPDLLGAGRK